LRIFSQLPDSCEELFTDLKEVVVQLAEDLAVEMDGHCSREGLRDVLGGLTIPDRDPGAPPLSQALFFAPMSPHVQACLRSLITRLGKHDYENILLRLLILVGHSAHVHLVTVHLAPKWLCTPSTHSPSSPCQHV
jgi:hypothetical protein